MDSNLPHLKFQSAEFINLADAEAIIDGVTIPLHSHVLSESSKVFAQLFSSFAEDDGTRSRGSKPISVTHLVSGESLEAVQLFFVLLYHREMIGTVFQDQKWGENNKYAPEPIYTDTVMRASTLQSAVRLADKLDCNYIIEQASYNAQSYVHDETIRWLILGRKLRLHPITAQALVSIARIFLPYHGLHESEHSVIAIPHHVDICAIMLRDRSWSEMDQLTVTLIMEANCAFDMTGFFRHGNEDISLINHDILDKYQPGDLLYSIVGEHHYRDAMGEEPQQQLNVLPDLQEQQAADDFDEEWEDEDPEVIDD